MRALQKSLYQPSSSWVCTVTRPGASATVVIGCAVPLELGLQRDVEFGQLLSAKLWNRELSLTVSE